MKKIMTASLIGIDADMVTVEIDVQRGLPSVYMVGLADKTIKEAKERVRAAVVNSGFEFPRQRITVNLSPANLPKEGSHFDLPIAVGILGTVFSRMVTEGFGFIGELSLDGRVTSVRGALPLAVRMREAGLTKIVLPEGNAGEVSLLTDMEIYPVRTLEECVQLLHDNRRITVYKRKGIVRGQLDKIPDFADVRGNEVAKRALTVAAAGNHGILMMGSPGSGKTMMAKRIPHILPEMTYDEMLEVTRIHSAAGSLNNDYNICGRRPFRSPHHTITKAAMAGGGTTPYPGEISLAHNGVLFLDELGEFDPAVIELLRQPLEEGVIHIHRSKTMVEFPCRIMLVAAANPCKCGYYNDPEHICTCTAGQLSSYRARFSGPMMDRIDMHITVNSLSGQVPDEDGENMSTAEMRQLVTSAVEMQQKRYSGTKILFNSRLQEEDMKEFCRLNKVTEDFLKDAYHQLGLSMRSYNKIIKISRTIADISGSSEIEKSHILEALQYRALDTFYRR